MCFGAVVWCPGHPETVTQLSQSGIEDSEGAEVSLQAWETGQR